MNRYVLGTFVQHARFGIGKVTAQDESGEVTVQFRPGESRRFSARLAANMKVLPGDGLEALLWTNPDETRDWTATAPLKLLGAVLTDLGGRAKAGLIREKLEGRVLDESVRWERWWGNVRSAAGDSNYFTVSKNKSNAIIGLGLVRGVQVKDIPPVPLPGKPREDRKSKKKAASKMEWKRWLLTETEEPPPARWPNPNVLSDLDKWTADEIQRALVRTIEGARDFVDSGSKADKGHSDWLNAVSRVLLRSRNCVSLDSNHGPVEQAGQLFCEAVRLNVGDGFEWPHVTTTQGDSWQRAFTAGIWSSLASRPSEIWDTFGKLRVRLERRQATALVEEICMAALRTGEPSRQDLDALLDAMSAGERSMILYNLIVRSAIEKDHGFEVVYYVRATRHAAVMDLRLRLLVLSALLIPDTPSTVLTEVSRDLADILESPERHDTPVQALLQEIRTRNQEWRARITGEVESERRVHEEQLERRRLDEERLRQQNAAFRAQMDSGRQESRLEVRKGMLLAIGDVLQRAHSSDRNIEERLFDVLATIPTVLREGGAEVLGVVGETVPFDPRIHHSTTHLPRGTAVRLSAPGVIVRGGALGDNVILKANVTRAVGDI